MRCVALVLVALLSAQAVAQQSCPLAPGRTSNFQTLSKIGVFELVTKKEVVVAFEAVCWNPRREVFEGSRR